MADNLNDINCPACGKKMVKVFMPEQGVNLDVCADGCGGIYFDNREFSKFDKPNENISPLLELLKDKQFQSVDTSLIRICPTCGANMVKNFTNLEHEIEVDECYSCGGKFLDYDEINKIRANFSNDDSLPYDFIKNLYNEVNVPMIDVSYILNKKKKRQKCSVLGLLSGIFISGLFLYYSSKMTQFNLFSLSKIELIITIIIILSICIICRNIGVLLSDRNVN